MKFLVQATAGPGFASSAEAVQLLNNLVLPSLDILQGWEKDNLMTGGLPAGGRAFLFVMEADSNESLDAMLLTIPLWGMLQWEVTPLVSFAERADTERAHLKNIS